MLQQLVLDGRVINRELVYRDIGFYETLNMVLACAMNVVERRYKVTNGNQWHDTCRRQYEDITSQIQTVCLGQDQDKCEPSMLFGGMDQIREYCGKERLIERLSLVIADIGKFIEADGILIKIKKSEYDIESTRERFYSAVEEFRECKIEFKFGD